MRRKRWFLVAVIVVLICIAAIIFSPLLIATGVRTWMWWNARGEHLTCKIDKIDAPFLRPVVLHGVSLTSAPNAAFRATLRVNLATVSLNLRSILLRTRARPLRYAALDGVRLELHRNEQGQPLSESAWSRIEKILPNSARIDNANVRVEDGPAVLLVRGASISFSDIETGRFDINEFTVASPFVRQTFPGLRGGTRWEGNALTLAGVALTRGFDLQSITFDLDHLNKQRIGCDFDADVFGGKFRGELSVQWRTGGSNWTVAASGTDVSLAQTAAAIGVAGHVGGQLQAFKFTFRGDVRDPTHATASVWAQLTAPSWRERTADVLMLGAFLYNRQLDVQQLYVKQAKNQLTLNAHGQLPERLADWLHAALSGSISAAVANLGDFAAFFGASPNDFAGQLSIDGTIDTHGPKFSGQLSVAGKAIKVFGSPADLLEARLSLANNVVEIPKLNLKRGEDFISAEGKIDIVNPADRTGRLDLFVRQIADYMPQLGVRASLKAHLELSGDIATVEPIEISGPTTIPFRGILDVSKPDDVIATLTAVAPTYVAPFTEDCVGRLELVPLPNPPPLVPRLEAIELHGSASSGLNSIILMTSVGNKTVRPSCSDAPNHALTLAAEPPPKH